MSYGRRNFIVHRSGASPPASNPKSLASYRNKAIGILVATSLYTAFLYRSGVCNYYNC